MGLDEDCRTIVQAPHTNYTRIMGSTVPPLGTRAAVRTVLHGESALSRPVSSWHLPLHVESYDHYKKLPDQFTLSSLLLFVARMVPGRWQIVDFHINYLPGCRHDTTIRGRFKD
jgi:hypothetical protein